MASKAIFWVPLESLNSVGGNGVGWLVGEPALAPYFATG